jgi:hypothetical protein
MFRKVMTMAALGALCAAATPAHAASTTQPGETAGVAAGAPLPPGLYFVNTLSWGERNDVDVVVEIPVLAWSTPWHFLGARVQFLLATPYVATDAVDGWYNVYGAAQLAWDLGEGWGVSYAVGGYTDSPSDAGVQSSSFNQRFAVSYTADGWNLTANVIHGHQSEDIINDFLNVDLTATKKIRKWEVGLVGFGSTDLNGDDATELSQFALGGLIGYDFGRFILQGYVTRDLVEDNYGEKETRLWSRLILPLRHGHDEHVEPVVEHTPLK